MERAAATKVFFDGDVVSVFKISIYLPLKGREFIFDLRLQRPGTDAPALIRETRTTLRSTPMVREIARKGTPPLSDLNLSLPLRFGRPNLRHRLEGTDSLSDRCPLGRFWGRIVRTPGRFRQTGNYSSTTGHR